MTVAHLDIHMSGQELAYWGAFDRIEPFGEIRADIRQGITTAMIYNTHKIKSAKEAKPSDYIVRPKVQQTQEDMLTTVVGLNSMFGGQDLRRT